MSISFQVAAAASTIGEDEQVVEVPIEGKTYIARKLTTAQAAWIPIAMSATTDNARLSAAFTVIEMLMGAEASRHIERLVIDRRIDFGDIIGGSEKNPEGGLIDQIQQEFKSSQRPSQPSTDSSSSRPTGGRKSTGRSPGKGSTRSTSTSNDS